MSYTFDTVQRAISSVRDAPNLTERQRDLLSHSQDVIDRWHTHGHTIQDAPNRDRDSTTAANYLQIVIDEPDKERQVARMNEYGG